MTVDDAVARAARQYDDIVRLELADIEAKAASWGTTPEEAAAIVELQRQTFAATRGRMLAHLRAVLETGHAVQ